MTTPAPPTPKSFSGSAQATSLVGTTVNPADMSFVVNSTSTWLETVGGHVGSSLGTSGPFVVTLDYGTTNEEKVLCSHISGTTITVAPADSASGFPGGRGYDGTYTSSTPGLGRTHTPGAIVVHTISTDTPYEASVALPLSGGIMSGAIDMNGQEVQNVAPSTTSTNAATYGQVSTVSAAAAAAQTSANNAQTTANNSQIASSAGYLAVKTTYPTLPQPLKVVGWTQSVAATTGGTAIAIPSGFTKVLLSVVGAYANEATTAGGFRVVVDTNGTNATDSFKAWIYNAAGTKQTSNSYTFSFMAIGY